MILSKYQITILNLFLISLLQIFWMFNRNKKTTLLSGFVNAEGFEPSTACLEGRCSIQLSYASINNQSGWQDSNLRPPAPKRRVRDSNPWYSFPYACLANMSFRPLRQLSIIRTCIAF